MLPPPHPPELSCVCKQTTTALSCSYFCCCWLQDSDHLWRLSPPARTALEVVLAEPGASLRMSWSVMRTAPLASGKGGPECTADVTVTLAGESRQQLREVREGHHMSAEIEQASRALSCDATSCCACNGAHTLRLYCFYIIQLTLRSHSHCVPVAPSQLFVVVVVVQMLAGEREWAQLMSLNASDPDGWKPGHTGPTGVMHVA